MYYGCNYFYSESKIKIELVNYPTKENKKKVLDLDFVVNELLRGTARIILDIHTTKRILPFLE